MKIQFLTLFWGILMACSAAAQQITIDNRPYYDGTYTLRISGLSRLSENPSTTQPPFYNVFWLFGDGEYFPVRNNEYGLTTSTRVTDSCPPCAPYSTSIPHKYTFAGKYSPLVIAADRKGDNPPPPDALRLQYDTLNPLQVNSDAQNPLPSISTVPTRKKIDISHSHGYVREGQNSIFIISYNPSCLEGQDKAKVHLFYGRKILADSNTYARSSHFSGVPTLHIPYYGQDSGTVRMTHRQSSDNEPFANHDIFDLPDTYIYDVKNRIGSDQEQRLFQEVWGRFSSTVKAAPDSLRVVEQSYALAVLTSNNSSCTVNHMLGNQLKEVVGYDTIDGKLNGQYIIDIDTIYLSSGEPDDPNSLKIEKVCSDGSIHFRLDFFNKPNAENEANGAIVRFNIRSPELFEWCSVSPSIEYGKYPEKKLNKTTKHIVNSCNFAKENIYSCSNYTFAMDGYLSRGGQASIKVVLKTKNNLRGQDLLNYLTQKTVLDAKVQLCPNPQILSLENEVVPVVLTGKETLPALIITDCVSQCEDCKPPEPPYQLKIKEVCTDGSIRLQLEICNRSEKNIMTGSIIGFKLLDDAFKWCGIVGVKNPDGIKRRYKERLMTQDCQKIHDQDDKPLYDCRNRSLSIPGQLKPGQCTMVEVVLKPQNEKLAGDQLLEYLKQNQILEAILFCQEDKSITVKNKVPEDIKISKCRSTCKDCEKKWWLRVKSFFDWF